MKTGVEYADQAKLSKYDKLSYSQYDCQAFCELVLKDIGVRQANGAVYNWKGSNDMYRHACSWVGTVDECRKKFGFIPIGAWAFMWDQTGNEKLRGYYDGLGNASHVGIFVGGDTIRDSTRIKNASGQIIRDGVGNRSLKQFQKIGLPAMLDFAGTNNKIKIEIDRDEVITVFNSLSEIIKKVEGWLDEN